MEHHLLGDRHQEVRARPPLATLSRTTHAALSRLLPSRRPTGRRLLPCSGAAAPARLRRPSRSSAARGSARFPPAASSGLTDRAARLVRSALTRVAKSDVTCARMASTRGSIFGGRSDETTAHATREAHGAAHLETELRVEDARPRRRRCASGRGVSGGDARTRSREIRMNHVPRD